MKHAVLLSLLLSGCITDSKGRVSLAAPTGAVGGLLVLGGAASAAGRCVPDMDRPSSRACESTERGDPATAVMLVLAGVSLLALAALIDRVE